MFLVGLEKDNSPVHAFERGYFALTDGERLSPPCRPVNSILLLPSLDEVVAKVLELRAGATVARFEPLGATHSFVLSTKVRARFTELSFTHRDLTVSSPCSEVAGRLLVTIEQFYEETESRFEREDPSSWVFSSLRQRIDELRNALCR